MAGIGAGLAALNLGARLTGAGAFVKRVPRWVWIALAIVLALVAVLIWHQHKVRAHDAALVKATIDKRDRQWRDQLAKSHAAAIAARTRHEAIATKISTDTKGIHDAQVRNNAASAHDLQLRGPGKAAAANCGPGYYPGVPAASGRPEQYSSGADASAAEVHSRNGVSSVSVAPGGVLRAPGSDFAVVPWSWLVDRGKEFDDLLADDRAFRTWYPKEAAEWERMRAAAQGKALAEPERNDNVR
jgi:hypothetical protein